MFKLLKNKIATLLRFTERYTRTDMLYFTKGGSALATNQIVAMIFSLILSVGFANLVPKNIFGTYQFVLATAAIIGAFSFVGIPAVISRAAAKGYEGALTQGFILRLKWNIGIVFLSGIGALYYFVNENIVLGTSFIIVGIFLPFLTSFSLYQSFLSGKKLFSVASGYGIIQNTIPILIMLTTIWFTNNPIIIVLAYYLATTLTIAALYTLTIRYYVSKPAEKYPDMVYEGKHNTFVNILDIATDQLDKLLVFHFLGAVQLAIYAFALAPIKQLRSHNKILKVLAFPKFVENDISTIKATLPRKLLLYFFALIILTAAYILFAPILYKILFPQYLDAVVYSQALALTLLFLPIKTLQKVFGAHFRKKEFYIANITRSLLTIFLLIGLTPFYGIWGVIIATLATKMLNGILVIHLFRKMF